jgi:cation:H+ antiporter
MSLIFFLIGLIILIKGADLLVDAAVSLAHKMNVSPIVIGLTIVSFGTSLPELVVNIKAVWANHAEIAIGTVFGSNIANILLVLGTSALFYPLLVKKNTVNIEIPFSIIITILVIFIINLDFFSNRYFFHGIERVSGIVFIGLHILFMIYVFRFSSKEIEEESKLGKELDENVIGAIAFQIPGTSIIIKHYSNLISFIRRLTYKTRAKINKTNYTKSILLIITGSALLFIGGELTVTHAVGIAQHFGVSKELIAFSIIAIGTCLPELVTSVVAAYKKNVDIAVGNVVGSNIFNILWVLGFSATLKPIPFKMENNIDVILTLAASLILFLMLILNKKNTLGFKHGIVLLILYAAYMYYLIIRG